MTGKGKGEKRPWQAQDRGWGTQMWGTAATWWTTTASIWGSSSGEEARSKQEPNDSWFAAIALLLIF